MTWQTAAQLTAATLLAFSLIGPAAMLYTRRPFPAPPRWWIRHAAIIISTVAWIVLLTIGGFWS